MHYSRVSVPASQAYSPASAVLMNELLKGSISFVIALFRVLSVSDSAGRSVVGVLVAFRRVLPSSKRISSPLLLPPSPKRPPSAYSASSPHRMIDLVPAIPPILPVQPLEAFILRLSLPVEGFTLDLSL